MPIPYADLEVVEVKPVSTANSGQPLNIQWTVINNGIGITSDIDWTDSLYLANDAQGNNIVQSLGSFNRAGRLDVGDTYDRTVTVNLPNTIAEGEYYLVAATNTSGNVFEFIYDDDNRTVSQVFTIDDTPLPDLLVTDIIAPNNITAGEKIDLTWSVENDGEGEAVGVWTDSIYLQAAGNTSAPLISLNSYSYNAGLEAGNSYTRQEKITIPSELQGIYQVVVKTNSGDSLYEGSNLENNTSIDAQTLSISLPPRADLQVLSIDAPNKVSIGGTLTVGFTVINQGTADTTNPNWYDRVYLSLDNEISFDDILISQVINGSALNPGESYQSISNAAIIPKRLRGDAYIIVETDADNQINELPQEENNTIYQKIEVEFDATGGDGSSGLPADLVTSNVQAPEIVFSGSTIDVTYLVTNKGIHTTDVEKWTDSIWLTKDKNRPTPIVNRQPEDILLTTVNHTGKLGVDQNYRKTVTVTIPEQLTGEWYITPWSDAYDAVLEDTFDININPDDPNELDSNNYKARPITVILSPLADLEVTNIISTQNNLDSSETSFVAGETINVTWTVENNGAGATRVENGWVDSVYLSDNSSGNSTNTWYLGQVSYDGNLDVNESYTQSVDFDLPPSAKGEYIVVKTDTIISRVNEGLYEDNNSKTIETTVLNAPADLVVDSISVTANDSTNKSIDLPSSYSGESLTVEWKVTNQGADIWDDTQYWSDQIWVSPDPTFIPQRAVSLGSFIYSPEDIFGSGDSYTQTRQVTLPTGIEGEYYIYVNPNYFSEEQYNRIGRDISKHREFYTSNLFEGQFNNNNLASTEIDVVYREADLKVTDLVVPTSPPLSGSTIPISWTTTNIGTRDTRNNFWYDRVYLSQDSSFDLNDTLLGTFTRRGALTTDSSYDTSLNVTLPNSIEGDYHLLVFTDSNIRPISPSKYVKRPPQGVSLYYEKFLVDTLARVEEFRDEGNNITEVSLPIILRQPPDLQVTAVDIPNKVTIGQSFEVSYTVENKGTGNPLNNGWSDHIYLSRDRFLDLNSDRFIGYVNHRSGLNADESYTKITTVTVPRDLSGAFYVFVITDPAFNNQQGNVFEDGLDYNNSLASVQPLLLEVPPPADLQVNNIVIPSSSLSGSSIDVEWQVTNTGPNQAEGVWSSAVYLSTDAIWDIEDIPLGKVEYDNDTSGNLAVGETITQNLQTILPPAGLGQYRLIVRTDIFDQVYEAENELNNITASANSLNVTVEELNLGIETVTNFNTGESRLYRFDVSAGETLKISIDANDNNAANEVFVRHGDVPSTTTHDFAYSGGLEGDQEVLIPTTSPGYYYVLVKNFVQPNPNQTTSILVESLPFTITNVVSDIGGDSRYVTAHIYGAQFDENALVKFVRPGIGEYVPVNYQVVDGTHIIAIFDFDDAPHGLYDVKVVNPDGEEAILPYRYLVEEAIEPDLTIGMGGDRVLSIGETGTYGVSFKSLTNVDTPYVYFQYGVPELGDNSTLINLFSDYAQETTGIYSLPYVGFTTNLRGQPNVNNNNLLTNSNSNTLLPNLPWASLLADVNTDGQNLAPGYIYDFPNSLATGLTFNAQAYPGLDELLKIEPDALRDVDEDVARQIGFKFYITASAVALTRDEFIAQQTQSALKLRDNILNDETANTVLLSLAANRDIWIAGYLSALESAGLLREEADTPPVRENIKAMSMQATLASGILVSAVGEQIITNGNILNFFSQLREWYGHDENLIGSNNIPNGNSIGNYSRPTHEEAFNIYVPMGGSGSDSPISVNVSNPDFSRFLIGEENISNDANIIAPIGAGSEGFVTTDNRLPYTIQFAQNTNASSSVHSINIVSQLDEDLDARSFRLGDLQIGDITVNIPEDRATFTGDFDFTASKGFILRVTAGIDPLSNVANWLLQAINPETGEIMTNPEIGLLSPQLVDNLNNGFVGYSILPQSDLETGTAITANARILYNNAPAIDTGDVVNIIDSQAPTTNLTVESLNQENNYLVTWEGIDNTDGAGVNSTTVYVSNDSGEYTIWQQTTNNQTNEEEAIGQQQTINNQAVFIGEAGSSYEFIALTTDNAGNRELPILGVNLPDDGNTVDNGSLTDVGQTSEPTPLPAPPPLGNTTTNSLFTEAQQEIPNNTSLTNPSEYNIVLRPFKASAFATGIPSSHGDISAMAIVELEDGNILISGGYDRGSIYKLDRVGGNVGTPWVDLDVPVFDLKIDSNGSIWATTGGGALLQLNGDTGEIIGEYGDGLTQSIAIDETTGLIYVSSGDGIEIFNPVDESFTRFSNLRVGNLEFDNDGQLWATRWPKRGEVVRFNVKVEFPGQLATERLDNQPLSIFEFDLPIDSLKFWARRD